MCIVERLFDWHDAAEQAGRVEDARTRGCGHRTDACDVPRCCRLVRPAVWKRLASVGRVGAIAVCADDGVLDARAAVRDGGHVRRRAQLGPVFTLFVETAIHRPDKLAVEGSVLPDWRALASTTAIALGVWMYEAHDVQFSAAGLFFLLLNLVLACAERMLQRHFLAVQKVEVSKPALMLLNNGIGAALALVVLLVMSPKEAKLLYHAMRHKPGTGLAVAASCLLGCAISYTGLWLQRLVTATSFMVLGSLTKLMVIAWGIVFLGDASGFLSIMGAAISVGGGFAYAHAISSKKS